MTPAEANQILYEDAFLRKREGLSVAEWEERLSEEKFFREASALAGPQVIDAITRMTWEWDRPGPRRKQR